MSNDSTIPVYGIELGRILAGQTHSPVVYFVRFGDGMVKIGTSRRLRKRLASLCLRLDQALLIVPGGFEAEAAYHDRFRAYRIPGGEIFVRTGELAEFLSQPPQPSKNPSPDQGVETVSLAPAPPVEIGTEIGPVSLRAAVAERIIEGTHAAVKMWRWRDPQFPEPVAHRGQTALYDRDELRDWQQVRHQKHGVSDFVAGEVC